jgi:hypothetical protein
MERIPSSNVRIFGSEVIGVGSRIISVTLSFRQEIQSQQSQHPKKRKL